MNDRNAIEIDDKLKAIDIISHTRKLINTARELHVSTIKKCVDQEMELTLGLIESITLTPLVSLFNDCVKHLYSTIGKKDFSFELYKKSLLHDFMVNIMEAGYESGL